ncbi:MAG: tRNA (N6-threonylcarbamoyladenosine(37)-N6)-methyltransferase TrmO, partial [bacterium]|nr:tRNA (N6-threonylcarbamoyladenosine(37)-N6)-methyltransferase TrmO [bacterium]
MMELRQIGAIRSEFKRRKGVPRLGGPGTVELFAPFGRGLHRIEKNSHLWVLVWMDQAERDILEVTPRGVTDRGPEGLHGIFAVRSPVRPNPIGLTLGRVLRVDGLHIHFDRLDFIDGTPVIDLKPYFLSRDAIYSASNTQIGKPANRDALRESLRLQAENFHGAATADTELAVDLYTHFRADLLDMVEPSNLHVTVPLDRPQLVDAFIGMTRATVGRGTLDFGPAEI